MMDWTDRHCRYFLRGFSPHTLLYTEMITAAAILRGDRDAPARVRPRRASGRLQLGGSNPRDLAAAARAGADAGYDEINLNCGCPSDRVIGGSFGACLMRQPELVADCVAAMKAAVRVPVTVKMRIGVVARQRAGCARRDRAVQTRPTSSDLHRVRRRSFATRAATSRSFTRARRCSAGSHRKRIARCRRFATTSCAA